MRSRAEDINRAYYEAVRPGRDDYWRKMAAPRHRLSMLQRLLIRDAPAKLVDLGCGNGAFLDEIERCLPQATLAGIDLSQPQIDLNRRTNPRVTWSVLNLDGPVRIAEDLQGSFDAVVAMELIEHLDHPDDFLRNARMLAAPGHGRLYLSTQSGRIRETERRVGHRRHFSASDMDTLLSATGWRPVRVWNTGFPFHDLSKWYANRNPDSSMQRFGEDAYGLSETLICLALRLAFRLNSVRRGAQLFAVAERPLDSPMSG